MIRSTRRPVRFAAAVAVVAMVLGACRTDWATWGNGTERQGNNASENTISSANVSGLHQLWSVDLGGFINAAPIFAADLPVSGQKTDLIFVGTELGEFYALRGNGSVLWHRNLGSHVANCPDTPGDTFGVQGTAVFDRATNRVFVMGGAGGIYALDPTTGTVLPGWPIQVTGDAVHNSVYGALTLFNNQLYVETGSHCDQRPYHGRLFGINTQTLATHVWWASGSGTGPDGGGIWGWGGASVDPADGNIYIATGNVIATPESSFYGDHVVRLDPSFNVVASNAPGVFIGDDDFGSTPTLFQKPGCPAQLAVEQKNGSLYLYDRASIAQGPRQRIVMSAGEDAQHGVIPVNEFIGVPAYSPQTQLLYVSNPTGTPDGAFTNGMVAFRLDANCNLVKQWQTVAGVKTFITSTPTVANGLVYYADGAANQVHAFDALTGQQKWNSGADVSAPMFTAPMVVNGRVYVGAYDNHLHAWGL